MVIGDKDHDDFDDDGLQNNGERWESEAQGSAAKQLEQSRGGRAIAGERHFTNP
jgi:hypothetical protein